MADNPFRKAYSSLESPAKFGFTVTANSDANVSIPYVTRAVYVGNGGNVHVRFAASQANVLFENVQSGTSLPIMIDKVWVANTTANAIVGLY